MTCPNCTHEMSRVRVYSECWQYGTLEGNKVVDYGSVEQIGKAIEVICDACGEDITDAIELG